jgi:hypothetical protein
MGFLKKIQNGQKEESSDILKAISKALAKTDDSTSLYAIYGMLEADNANKFDVHELFTLLNMITNMKDELSLKNDAIELITTKIVEKGDSALTYLKEIAHKRKDLKIVIKRLIYYIESSQKIDEFGKIFKK